MDRVEVAVSALREILVENRDKHRETFNRAVEIYRSRVLEWLEQRIDDIKNGRKIDHRIRLPEPLDYTSEYDRAIKMLEMTVDDTVVISQRDFARLVMDEWEWKEAWTTTTASYLVTEG